MPVPIQVVDVSAGYGSYEVLYNISLTIMSGEFCALIGPNGGGKSTLLKVIGGLLPPSSGQVLLDDKPLEAYSLSRRSQKISYLPQEIHVEFNLSARQAVYLGRYPHLGLFGRESAQDDAIVDSILERVHLQNLAHRPLDSLSVGQRQRVWLASCMAQRAPILLLDEPTASLDLGQTWRMLQLIRQEQSARISNPMTVVGVFHDLDAVKNFCARVIAIKEGKIVADGVPQTLLTDDFVSQLYDLETLAR